MALKGWWKSLFNKWPHDLPRLYPGMNDLTLATFMTQADYERIRSFATPRILPFVSRHSAPDEAAFGTGLSHLMMRNLMLLRDISIRGPEDTPWLPCETVQEHAGRSSRMLVTGRVTAGQSGYSLNFAIVQPGDSQGAGTVRERSLPDFIRACTLALARALGSSLEEGTPEGWSTGQPGSESLLTDYGRLVLQHANGDKVTRAAAAVRLLLQERTFSLPAWQIDNKLPDARKWYLDALQADPFNAQLYFETFCAVWHGQHPEAYAMQFCRKAIELSPGHGKAHMCAPHAAHPEAQMLRHSELGYRLLPGNSYAINNYVSRLVRSGAPAEQVLQLAMEGVACGPENPGNYYQLIDLLSEAESWEAALQVALRLQTLFEPVINERAIASMRQGPKMARLLDSGLFDPVTDTQNLIRDLRAKVAGLSAGPG